MLVLKVVLYVVSIIHMISIVLALVKKDFWVFRIFDYPRMQKFVMMSIVVVLMLIYFRTTIADITLIILLIISLTHLAWLILPFTMFSKTMIDQVAPGNLPIINLLVANVREDNTEYDKLLQLVKSKNPDILFLLETNKLWMDNVAILKEEFPYVIEVPKENTYGLLFFSKLKIVSSKVNYLIDPEIPSIIADIEFDQQLVKIYGLHPTPPTPTENDKSTDRDAEILMVGKMVKDNPGPCMVIGDLNDVAWSYTTDLFLKTSGLLDPRRGRGFYNTFNANYKLFRWPLDHYFLSGHFRLVEMKVEPHIGSDHFPISISLVISSKDSSEKLTPSAQEKETADEKIVAGFNNN